MVGICLLLVTAVGAEAGGGRDAAGLGAGTGLVGFGTFEKEPGAEVAGIGKAEYCPENAADWGEPYIVG